MLEKLMYEKSIKIEFNPSNHRYTVFRGRKVIKPLSVTEITGVVNKPALVHWAVKLTQKYLKENWSDELVVDRGILFEFFEVACNQHREVKDQAANIGTIVHKWVEDFTAGNTPALPSDEMALNAVHAFLQWVDGENVKFLESERIIYSKKYNYAGITDAIARIGKKLVLIDYKTSSGIWPEMYLQTAGYQNAWQEETGKKIDYRLIIRFDKDTGEPEVRMLENFKEDCKGFIGALTLKKRLNEIELLTNKKQYGN